MCKFIMITRKITGAKQIIATSIIHDVRKNEDNVIGIYAHNGDYYNVTESIGEIYHMLKGDSE